jgi:hypothetical protein
MRIAHIFNRVIAIDLDTWRDNLSDVRSLVPEIDFSKIDTFKKKGKS